MGQGLYLLLGLVATLFLGIGTGFFFLHFYYRIHGKELFGKVVAIEKYASVSRSGSERTVNTYYRAIYEYLFNGEIVWFAGSGSSNLSYEIGQRVKILSLPTGPEYCHPKNNIFLIFATVFSAFGVAAIIIAWYHLPTWPLKVLPLILVALGLLVFRQVMIKKGLWSEIKNGLLKNSRLETRESLAGREVYWTKKQIEVERGKYATVALIVSFTFFGVTSALSYFLWFQLPTQQQHLALRLLNGQADYQELMTYKDHSELLIFLILGFFTLLSVYSLFYSLFKISRS